MTQNTVNVAIIGLGFMGRTHLGAYLRAAADGHKCTVTLLADTDAAKLDASVADAGNMDTGAQDSDLSNIRKTTDIDEVFHSPDVDLVSICTHTDSHPDLAIRAINAGKHVLVEKPVALSDIDARRVVTAASKSDTICMPAMCMRFWPGWTQTREFITRKTFGKVTGATFQRLGSPPTWSPEFYNNKARSGGALLDLHIHDADWIRWVFGDPVAVTSTGTTNHLTTIYHYEHGPSIVAEGGWEHQPSFGFRMRFVMRFEQATIDFDLARDNPLMLYRNDTAEPVEIESLSAYDFQVRHIIDRIGAGLRQTIAPIEDALAITQLLDAERRSLESGATVEIKHLHDSGREML